jgi:hypothetical protein
MMDVVSVSTRSYLDGLPEPLRVAQEAVNLPEVQEMARKLATYNLGVFMPHTHNERTGAFDEMPSGIIQVEEGLAVSFRSAVEIENDQARHVPVGWVWRDDGLTAALNCVQTCVQSGSMHTNGHVSK